ncbi:protein prenylyltransferase [Acaromyces ingoldii]|uniref:Geranylgeranyl transferase type-2 subunit alpha n=1 Tax=Acaromyces ingoldii TaxID=215250 RepID=A0A316YNS7_9BASI|nr:protein prenylyltransferase [Acaromyces ingoldii]PWN90812.1 protein prenylyltransferase [Acaromyces ingoldii]
MHGVRRDRSSQTAEARAARKAKEASKLQAYLEVQSRFFELKSRKEHSQDSLAATTKILTLSPELYTAWNFRRDVLKELFKGETVPIKEEKKDFFASVRIEEDLSAASASKRNDGKEERRPSLDYKRSLLEDDLELTTHALRAHPKVYWIWNHRRWCLEEYPDETGTKWKRELAMVDKMLEMDPRNFHGWTHRRYIFSRLASSTTSSTPDLPLYPYSLTSPELSPDSRRTQLQLARQELSYSLSKIETNFSNFSAWHRRSILLPLVWQAESLSATQMRKRRDEEFDLIKQALFTDPDDQSVWIYHEWLIDKEASQDVLEREIEVVRELVDLEPDSKLCMRALSHNLSMLSTVIKGHDPQRAKSLSEETRDLLQRLVEVDPDRKGRYLDLLQGLTA